jgi:hypothetical protein
MSGAQYYDRMSVPVSYRSVQEHKSGGLIRLTVQLEAIQVCYKWTRQIQCSYERDSFAKLLWNLVFKTPYVNTNGTM